MAYLTPRHLHANISTTLVYARLHDGAAAEALERHGEQVLRISGAPKLLAEQKNGNGGQ